MGYCIYDSNGYVGDLASNKGLKDLTEYVEKHPDTDELTILVNEGSVLKTKQLIDEIGLLGAPKDVNVAKTLTNLKELIGKASDVIIITDGSGL